MRRRLFLSLIISLMTLSAMAGAKVTIDGIVFDYTYTVHYENPTGHNYITATVIVEDGKSKEGEVVIPSSIVVDGDVTLFVTKIGRNAFDGNKNITKVTIPGCVTIIDGYAFRDCSSLETVVINTETSFDEVFMGQEFDFHGLTQIQNDAFNGCTNLRNINIPETVTYLGYSVFSSCTSLESITLPNSLQSVSSTGNIFGYCTNLESVSLPGGIDIPYRTFINCTKLESVTLRGAIKGIGEDAFRGCSSLPSINLSKGVNAISGNAFLYCSSLESVTFPETGLTSIGSDCFASTAIKSINVPASVTFIGSGFCGSCTQLTEAVIQGGVYSSSEIGQFINCTNLKTATITWTGELSGKMFQGCSSLETVNLSSGITAIRGNAFNGCTSLEVLTLPNTVTSIKGEAFLNCTALKSIKMLGSITEIGVSAFRGCTSLGAFAVPSGVTDLSNSVFEGCSSLENVTLPSSMTRIGYGSFKDCIVLEQLNLPSSLTTIDHDAFKGCSSLNNLVLPAGLETVNTYAFANCTSLQSLIFPASMQTLGTYAFSGCTSMELIDLRLSTQLGITSTERTGVFGGVPETTVILLPGSNPQTETKEPYAVLSDDNKTLTFYYDENKESRSGMSVGPFVRESESGWYNHRKDIISVVFDTTFDNYTELTSTAFWFFEFENLSTITGIEYLNTDNVTDMSNMFNSCSSLTSLDVSHFITENVTNISAMFVDCKSLTSLDVSNFITENVTDMSDMFIGCSSLRSLDVSKFNTAKVTDMGNLFAECLTLSELDLTNFNTTNVKSMYQMFASCSSLTTIYVGVNWNTDKVTSSNNMFLGCTSLAGGKGTNFDAGHIDHTYAHIDGGTNNPGYFTQKGATPPVGTKEPYAVVSNDNKTLTFYYDENKEANSGLSVGPFEFVSGGLGASWSNWRNSIQTIVFDDSFADYHDLTSTAFWFVDFYVLTTIAGIGNLNTENVTSMKEMFYDCAALQSLDVSHFETGNVEDMSYMFRNCSSLTSLDVSNFDTRKVTNMYGMFDLCIQLESIDLSNFDTRNVTNLSNMFYRCLALTTIYIGKNWNTGNVTSSDNMFYGSTKLVGSKGTTYDAAHIDYTYAHVDGGTSNPGYFTQKGQSADPEDDIIHFVDSEVKRICVANWDTSGDGEISYKEAKAVTDLNKKFANNAIIESFDELQYFTGLKALKYQEGGQFENCEKLKTITLPEGLEEIGVATFNYCRALEGIAIPASVTTMSYLGGWYYDMTTITVAAGNNVYDSRNNCNAVIETTSKTLISGCNNTVIPNTVTAIGPFAFNACVTDKITIPTSVITIGKSAFSTCQFTEVELPSSITSIDISFTGCNQIEKVVSDISEPFAIADETFPQDVYDNATLWVPTEEAVTKYKAADGWKNFKDIRSSVIVIDDGNDGKDYFMADIKPKDNNSAEISGVEEAEGNVSIPTTVNVLGGEKTVTSIGDNAFAGMTSLTSVTIPATITNIGDGAFDGCTNLEFVDLSNASGLVSSLTLDNVDRDGSGAFAGLNEGTVIVLPSDVPATTAKVLSEAEPNIVYSDGGNYKSENVKLIDGVAFKAPASITQVTASAVTYARSFNRDDVVYSLCMPYDQPISDGLRVYELDEFTGEGALIFKEVSATSIEAAKPYLVTSSGSVSNMQATNVIMHIDGNSIDKDVTDYSFCGALSVISNAEATFEGYLILQSDKKWHKVSAGNVTIPAGRAYLKPNVAGARAILFTMFDDDDVSGIKTIDLDGTIRYYDLNGYRIEQPTKAGLYIRDGKKVVVK